MDDDDCRGVRVIEFDRATTDGAELVIHLAEPLTCPECQTHARTWVVPLEPQPGEQRVTHRVAGDPGE